MRQRLTDEKRNDFVKVFRHLYGKKPVGFQEKQIGEGTDMIDRADGNEDEEATYQYPAVQLLRAVHRHKADNELRLCQTADAYAKDKRRNQRVPLRRTSGRHCRPALMPHSFKIVGHHRRKIGQFAVGFDKSHIQRSVKPEQQKQHTEEHNHRLQGIRVHDPFQSAGYHIRRHYQRENKQRQIIVYMEHLLHKDGSPFHHYRCIEGHTYKYNRCNKHLHPPRAVVQAQQLRERPRIMPRPQLPRPFPEKDKGYNHPDQHIEHTQPLYAHPERRRYPPEADNSRCRDERCPVGKCHDSRICFSSSQQEVSAVLRVFVAQIAQPCHEEHVHNHDKPQCQRTHRSELCALILPSSSPSSSFHPAMPYQSENSRQPKAAR
ncbi:hypothetical protein Barb7_01482 [Bacteroidales bacterium Barb7]|nr:hypothetical protein Barb7_01482 [Bacteroidales bacterium Barb7]